MPIRRLQYTRRRKGGSGARATGSRISRLSPSSESKKAAEADKKGKAVAAKADEAARIADRDAALARGTASRVIAIVEEMNRSADLWSSSDDEDGDKMQQSVEGKKNKKKIESRSGIYMGEVKGRFVPVKHGLGQITRSFSTYQGEWKDDKENGFGVLTVTPNQRLGRTGYRYEGQFKDGEMTGYGVCVYSSGDVYRGHHLADEYDGYGVYLHIETTGGVSKCEYKGSVKDGFGTYESDNMSHSGLYSKDRFVCGRGTIHSAAGTYTGDLKGAFRSYSTLQHGNGRFVYANGDIYDGQFKNGNIYGKGKLTRENGTVEEGIWSGNRLTGEVTPAGQPTLYGEFVSGVPLTQLQMDTYSDDSTDNEK